MKVSDFSNIKCDPAPTNVSLFSVIVSLWSITTSLVEWWLFSIFGQCFVNMQTHEITSSQHFFFNHAMSFKVITIFIFQVSLVASIQRSRWSRWWILCNRKMKNENISMFSISLDFLSLTLKAHLAHANDTWETEKSCVTRAMMRRMDGTHDLFEYYAKCCRLWALIISFSHFITRHKWNFISETCQFCRIVSSFFVLTFQLFNWRWGGVASSEIWCSRRVSWLI